MGSIGQNETSYGKKFIFVVGRRDRAPTDHTTVLLLFSPERVLQLCRVQRTFSGVGKKPFFFCHQHQHIVSLDPRNLLYRSWTAAAASPRAIQTCEKRLKIPLKRAELGETDFKSLEPGSALFSIWRYYYMVLDSYRQAENILCVSEEKSVATWSRTRSTPYPALLLKTWCKTNLSRSLFCILYGLNLTKIQVFYLCQKHQSPKTGNSSSVILIH